MAQSIARCIDFSNDSARKKRTNALVRAIKNADQDYEFYPTTQEQINVIHSDMLAYSDGTYGNDNQHFFSVLDIGAGDGRVLAGLTAGKKYGIEKSAKLVEAMPTDVFVIGSDFFENQLLDKRVDVIFSNPPYLEFSAFAKKIIAEAHCSVIYLILPQRWSDDDDIKYALKARRFENCVSVIGSFDYLEADRVARAKVDIIKIECGSLKRSRGYAADPFNGWFDENFPMAAPKTAASAWAEKQRMQEEMQKNFAGAITSKRGVIPVLSEMYQDELAKLMDTYRAITEIPYDLVKELNICSTGVKEGLKLKVANLKDVYWAKLFDELSSLTAKLTSETRKKLLDKLTSATHVDFNSANAANIVIWAIKQSNAYFDEQIVSVFETMSEAANIELYASNQNTVQRGNWRYTRRELEMIGHYGLDHRIVLHRVGGYSEPDYQCRGLAKSGVDLLDDICVIARHIGFDVNDVAAAHRDWSPGAPHTFGYQDMKGNEHVLFEARAYRNGNLHIKLNQRFIQKLNCVHGKLKGWLKSSDDAVREMNIEANIAQEAFDVNMRIGMRDVPLLGYSN